MLDLAALLFGAEAAGIADWCVTSAAAYAKVREQFGRPIGQFQGIKHMCARMLVALEQARAVVWDAARALDEARAGGAPAGTGRPAMRRRAGERRHGSASGGRRERSAGGVRLAAAIAAVIAADAAVSCAQDCIQVHGGIGYTWEHDAHIYYRRALTLRALTGSPARWADHVATLALDGAKRELDVDLPADAEPLRESIAAEIAGIAALPRDEQVRKLAADGLVVPHLPKPWGRGAGPLEQILIQQEMRAARVRPPYLVIGAWVVPSLASYGTPEQQQRFLPGDAARRDRLVPAVQRAGFRQRPGLTADARRARRRRLEADRAEDLDVARPPGAVGDLPGPDRYGARSTRGSRTSSST